MLPFKNQQLCVHFLEINSRLKYRFVHSENMKKITIHRKSRDCPSNLILPSKIHSI